MVVSYDEILSDGNGDECFFKRSWSLKVKTEELK